MQLATIEEIRLHLNLETDDLDEDMTARLEMYRDASVELLKTYLNKNLYEDEVPEDDSNGTVITAEIKQAQLLLIGEMFKNRENSNSSLSREIPLTAQKILMKKRYFNI